ncbi:hypothetical protein AaE_007760 [Aphanomyces astaci]|uniref:Carbonic anhydrase n=1 Tax=Aphanomyces astaci TaxID=112090 RepID=A0A6A5ADM9_APHAT|nr:hypothetical protein AaE_007760 [Aphanomyces astaci]
MMANHHQLVLGILVGLAAVLVASQQHQSPIKLSSSSTYTYNQGGSVLSWVLTTPTPPATSTATPSTLRTTWSVPPFQVALHDHTITLDAVQCHFHHPSEHWLNGMQYPFELHIVLASSTNHSDVKGVVAVIFDINQEVPHPFIAQLWPELRRVTNLHPGTINISSVDVTSLRLDAHTSSYFRYRGSLTTAPFTEGIEWIVQQNVHSISVDQSNLYTQVFPLPKY